METNDGIKYLFTNENSWKFKFNKFNVEENRMNNMRVCDGNASGV